MNERINKRMFNLSARAPGFTRMLVLLEHRPWRSQSC